MAKNEELKKTKRERVEKLQRQSIGNSDPAEREKIALKIREIEQE